MKVKRSKQSCGPTRPRWQAAGALVGVMVGAGVMAIIRRSLYRMEAARPAIEPPLLAAWAGSGRSASPRHLWGRSFLILALWVPIAGPAIDSRPVGLANHLPAEPQTSKLDRRGRDASMTEAKFVDRENAPQLEAGKMSRGPRITLPAPTGDNYDSRLLAVAFLLGAGLASRRIINLLNQRPSPDALSSAAAADTLAKLGLKGEAVSKFPGAFRTGPTAPAELTLSDDLLAVATHSSEREAVKEFFAKAPEILRGMRKLLRNISMSQNENARRMMLPDLHRELRDLKGAAGLSELRPAWQMAAAVERLVEQLTDGPDKVTPSTLRTLAGGVDSLKDFCVPGLRADLFTNPPIRLLAVDDDPICRKIVALALNKAFNQPDLAENGEAALALATQRAYDVIFLDVQMPEMDGFELCKKIHETIPNANTPVVFVTICSDFEARAKSVLSGGSGLIAKPFLTFEITVKALTFALRGAAPTARSDRRRLPPRK